MKKQVKYFAFMLIIITALILNDSNTYGESKQKNKSNLKKALTTETINPEHSKWGIVCKTCHSCEYPTKKDPCLIICPRKSMISVYHSPEEAPEVLHLDKITNRYGGVVFAHKLHAQMSGMSEGCSGCHHYNTTGPILNCKNCHESNRKREDISKPDLMGAYHKQCVNCHRQWSGEANCNSQCHQLKDANIQKKIKSELTRLTNKEHPKLAEPVKMIFDTKYEKGKTVTFHHDEHIKVFNISCISCHKHENCIKCHDKNTTIARDENKHITISKSLDEHHKPCSSCHKDDKCDKCHAQKEMSPFNHLKVAKFDLNGRHSNLECSKCHKKSNPFDKPNKNCDNCHQNFALGKFKHDRAGLVLSENHNSVECDNCHANNDFSVSPACNNCHDDKSFPKDKPGKIAKVKAVKAKIKKQ